MELTIATAMLAGLLSFLSPCVLPVVPAYLGQLGALTVAGAAGTGAMAARAAGGAGGAAATATATAGVVVLGRRWHALIHALAFVFGFGLVFTLLGVTVSYFGQGLSGQDFVRLQKIGGVLLVILGLNVAGLLRLPVLSRSWRPLDRFAARRRGSIATRTPLGAFGLGAVFALGWTPCIGPTLGAIFGLASLGATAQAGVLFAAYSVGLGVPFVLLALALDRAPAITRPLVRHGRVIEILGGLLVVLIGLAIVFDVLPFLYQTFGRFFPTPA